MYLFLKGILVIYSYDINITTLIIPAIALYTVFHLREKLKIYNIAAYTALILSFVTFNISTLSNGMLFAFGIIGIMVTSCLIYTKEQCLKIKFINIKKLYEILLPIYSYILIARIPFVLIKDLSNLQIIMILCITSILLSIFKFIVNEKYMELKLGYSKVATILLIICGVISIAHLETMVLMIISLVLFQAVSIYKKLNKISYAISLGISISTVINLINND